MARVVGLGAIDEIIIVADVKKVETENKKLKAEIEKLKKQLEKDKKE